MNETRDSVCDLGISARWRAANEMPEIRKRIRMLERVRTLANQAGERRGERPQRVDRAITQGSATWPTDRRKNIGQHYGFRTCMSRDFPTNE